MEIRTNVSSIDDIKGHLWSVSPQFVPELSSYVDIDKYAEKLYNKAQRIEFWENGHLEGLLAYYLNVEGRFAFITNVSVSPEIMGGGVASKMIKRLIEDNKGIIDVIRLEVNAGNERAIHFYDKNGFVQKNVLEHGTIIMERDISVST